MEAIGSTKIESDRLYSRAKKVLPGGNSRTTLFVAPHPPYALKGSGYLLTDVDGNEKIDVQNNYTSLIHGHANPEVVAAVNEAVSKGASFGLPTEYEIELAEMLCQRSPALERVRFASSGTEAVMTAVRLARAATGRSTVLRFDGSYHGSYDAVLGGRGVPEGVDADVIVLPVGDLESLLEVLERESGRIAAVLFDGMPNRAGLRPADPEYARVLRQETRRHGTLLIQDEVLTYRVGMSGMHGILGIEPDLVTLGKVIGGGHPIGAIAGREEVMAEFNPLRKQALSHGGTFSANPVTLAAGIATMKPFGSDAIQRLNGLGDRLRVELLAQGWEVTGLGSLMRVHVDDPAALWWQLYRTGVLISGNGLVCLSTPMDGDVIAEIADRFAAVRRMGDHR